MIAVPNAVKMEVAKVVLLLGVSLTIASSSNKDSAGIANFSVFFLLNILIPVSMRLSIPEQCIECCLVSFT